MAKLSVKEIQTLAKKIVAENPGGIRYGALVQRISMENPETPKNTIRWLRVGPRHALSERNNKAKPRSVPARHFGGRRRDRHPACTAAR